MPTAEVTLIYVHLRRQNTRDVKLSNAEDAMKANVVHILMVMAPLLPAGALLYARSLGQTSPPLTATRAELIQQPPNWVPFSAQLQKTISGGGQIAGRYYQGRDGSTRYETGLGPVLFEVTGIGIKNIKLQKFFKFNRRDGWTEQPMQLPADGWYPRPALASIYVTTDETLEGLRLVKKTSADTVRWFAPELNLFTVKTETRDCGAPGVTCLEQFYNFRREDQPEELFNLPADADNVTLLSVPGGIIKRER
jgi:hypothetical protein